MYRPWTYPALSGLLLIAGCSRPAPQTQQAATSARDSAPSTAQPDSAPAVATPPDSARSDTAKALGATTAPSQSAASKPAPPKPEPARPARDTNAKPTAVASADSQAQSPPLRDPYHTAPLDTVDAKTYQGWKYFNLNCARCHGEDVSGTTIAPHLIVSLKPGGPVPDEATFQTTVCGGRVAKGMPAWCTLGMTPAQIDTIYAYVKGRSDAKLHPGRPARQTT